MPDFVNKIFPRSSGASNGGAPAAVSAGPGSAPAGASPELRALENRRTELARTVADRQWDLGGVTYEMAIRDHFRMDVLVRLAAELQKADAELAEIERQLKLGSDAAAGQCPGCRAEFSRGATFCWSCGAQLMETRTPELGS